ncbi:hypothetical protein [Actinopolymorpha rutila]|uniref:Peptidase propeptide and YPEB domain-containing protein n=1 Tax=Actinopolymorpha rutila TaxID=446787 RepID=A0A852ZFY8_9ACTN|nr:hypothetical protein [Actinopolymorpha rutila]NYH91075.1 hypothetical protein [Actinopolymorpha rutila]
MAAVVALLASILWVGVGAYGHAGASGPGAPGYGRMHDHGWMHGDDHGWMHGDDHGWMHRMHGPGYGMMYLTPGTGPVADMAAARRAAQRAAGPLGLRVGEIMQFSNGYYAEFLTSTGRRATEVLIDPSGAVHIEYGPAMMWNTTYGMNMMMRPGGMPGDMPPGPPGTGSTTASVSPSQARRLADLWLQQHQTGLRAGDPEAFPGYYTLHTQRGDRIVGMLSVNAQSGAVWYHTWHGQFLRTQEPARTSAKGR